MALDVIIPLWALSLICWESLRAGLSIGPARPSGRGRRSSPSMCRRWMLPRYGWVLRSWGGVVEHPLICAGNGPLRVFEPLGYLSLFAASGRPRPF